MFVILANTYIGFIVPGTILGILHTLSYLIFITILRIRYYCCLHFIGVETEAQRV